MLKKLTNKGDWEVNEKNITTKGGTFVGYASTPDNALVMAAGPKLIDLINKRFPEDKTIQQEVDAILNSLKS